MTHIFFIRHANSEEKKETERARLTPHGIKQAQALAERLQFHQFHVFYTSSYLRSKHTAKIIAEPHTKRTLKTKEELTEVDFRIKKRLSLASFKELRDFYTKSEVEQIENLLKAQKRGLRLIEHLFKSHPDQNIIVTTHGNVIKAIILGIMQLKLARFQKFVISEASVSRIFGTNISDTQILSLNDTAHLSGL